MKRTPSAGNINWELMSPARIYDNAGGGGGASDAIFEKAKTWSLVLSSKIPTPWYFQLITVSNNIRYFYHIFSFLAFIRQETRFGTRASRYLKITNGTASTLMRRLGYIVS